MKSIAKFSSAALLMVAGATAMVTAEPISAPPPVPATPAGVQELVYAQPFVLGEGYSHGWRKEFPTVSSGYLLVVKVNPDMVYPRQTLEPVLYVGNQTAERVNHGHESGYVVVLVPAPLTKQGTVDLDLTTSMIWFGTPALPEQVDAAKITGEIALAQKSGIAPFSAEQIQAVTQPQISLTGKRQLLAHLAPLIIQYSPPDAERGQQFLRNQDAPTSSTKK